MITSIDDQDDGADTYGVKRPSSHYHDDYEDDSDRYGVKRKRECKLVGYATPRQFTTIRYGDDSAISAYAVGK